MPQFTIKAVLLGALLSAVLAGANAYLGLFAGLTVSASIPAAVISMGLLKLLRGSILENNIVQTTASAGESLAAGAIFTLPALVLIGAWEQFDYGWSLALTGLGGLLGVLFTIPLRRALILEQQLIYPEGTATAEVLRSGHGQSAGLKTLALGGLVGGVIKFCEAGLGLWRGIAETAVLSGKSVFYVGTNLSPALLGVGYIVGLNIGLLVLVGGVIAWYIAIPIWSAIYAANDPALAALIADGNAEKLAWTIWTTKIRFLGVGAMLVGGLWTLFSIRHALLGSLRVGVSSVANAPANNDIPPRWVFAGVAACLLPLIWLYWQILDNAIAAVPLSVLMIVAAFLFSAVAAYMAGIVGSSHNPVSGVTIATILLASLLLLMIVGHENAAGPAGAIMVGAVVCCAAAIGGDNMQDLKAGYLLGATPWKQQLAQMLGVVVAAAVIAPVLGLLYTAYGFGPPTDANPNSLAAPQATLMASVASGVFGAGLPWGMIAAGAVLGAIVIGFDVWLKRRNSHWQAPVLAVAVGIYLPLELAVPIAAGGFIAWLARRDIGASVKSADKGMLLAAGLITGEALMGIALAVPIALEIQWPRPDVAAMDWLGLLVVALVGLLLWKTSANRAARGRRSDS